VKGGQHVFDGGGSSPASFVPLPSTLTAQFSRRIRLMDESKGVPLGGMPYFMRLKSGVVYHGVTDDDGFTDVAQSNQAEQLETSIGHAALKKISKLKGKG
jgi:type VI secretion system secreted protein VgrG